MWPVWPAKVEDRLLLLGAQPHGSPPPILHLASSLPTSTGVAATFSHIFPAILQLYLSPYLAKESVGLWTIFRGVVTPLHKVNISLPTRTGVTATFSHIFSAILQLYLSQCCFVVFVPMSDFYAGFCCGEKLLVSGICLNVVDTLSFAFMQKFLKFG